MRYKIFIPIIIISLALGFFIGIEYQNARLDGLGGLRELINRDVGQPPAVDFSLFWDAWNLVHQKYVDRSELDTRALVFGAIKGMVESIGDPFTVFLTEKESKRLEEDIKGEFFGVGIEIGIRDDVLTVISPLEGTPAAKAGLREGDKIIKIDDESTTGITLEEAVSKIRGKRGTKVVLTISRAKDGKDQTRDFEIIRGRIKIPTVKWEVIEPGIGYIHLFSFNQAAKSEFDKALSELRAKGAGEKLILDLRNNPGGLLDLAIDISSYFLEAGDVVVIESFGNGNRQEFKARSNGSLKDAKVVVLINKGSASASEIVGGRFARQ